MQYRFGGCAIDRDGGRLVAHGEEVPIQPLAWKLLVMLVERPGVVLGHDELHAALWPGIHVTADSLSQLVRRVRRALGPDGDLVESLPRRGYRFTGTVTTEPASADPPPPTAQHRTAPSFVGRSAELAAVAAARPGPIAIVGPAGVGKTRLAREVLRHAAGAACWASLGRLDPSAVPGAVMAALGEALDARAPAASVGLALEARGPILVVLDDLPLDAVPVVDDWARSAPAATFLVTQRAVPRLVGARVVRLDVLSVPDAVTLLGDRAGEPIGPDAAIEALVTALDRLPLALELAAPRARLLGAADLLGRLRDRFAVLPSLEVALAASWDGLGAEEQRGLGALSVFVGGFGAADAEAVVGGDPVELLEILVDRSLVQRDGQRLFLLDAVRDFARAHAAPADLEAATLRHAAWFARLGAREVVWLGDRAQWLPLARLAIDELVAACRAGRDRGMAEIVESTALVAWEVLRLRGEIGLAIELLDAATAVPGPRCRVVASKLGTALRRAGRMHEALRWFDAGRRMPADPVDRRGDDVFDLDTAISLAELGRMDDALALAKRCVEACRRADDTANLLVALSVVGFAAVELGDTDAAFTSRLEAVGVATERGDADARALALHGLAGVSSQRGLAREAAAQIDEAVALRRSCGDRVGEARALSEAALIAGRCRDADRAVPLAEAALAATPPSSPRLVAAHRGNLGMVLVLAERIAEGCAALREALRVHDALGEDVAASRCLSWLAYAHLSEGRVAEAVALADRAVERAGDSRTGRACAQLVRADALDRAGRAGEALMDLATAEAILRPARFLGEVAEILVVRARIWARSGDAGAAVGELDEAQVLLDDASIVATSRLSRDVAALRARLAGPPSAPT